MTPAEEFDKQEEMTAAALALPALIAAAPPHAAVDDLVQNAAEIGRKLRAAVYGAA